MGLNQYYTVVPPGLGGTACVLCFLVHSCSMEMYQLCIDMEGFVAMIRTLKLGREGGLAQRQSTCLRSPTLGSHKKKKKKKITGGT